MFEKFRKALKNWEQGKGHISIGLLTIYGDNAMHWAMNFWTDRWGYICFRPTTGMGRAQNRWYLYASRNATPWARTWGIGPGLDGR